jgi:hypothetical protein
MTHENSTKILSLRTLKMCKQTQNEIIKYQWGDQKDRCEEQHHLQDKYRVRKLCYIVLYLAKTTLALIGVAALQFALDALQRGLFVLGPGGRNEHCAGRIAH